MGLVVVLVRVVVVALLLVVLVEKVVVGVRLVVVGVEVPRRGPVNALSHSGPPLPWRHWQRQY